MSSRCLKQPRWSPAGEADACRTRGAPRPGWTVPRLAAICIAHVWIALVWIALVWISAAAGQTEPSAPKVADELAIKQGDLADRFDRLEKLMLRMAEFDQAANPRRAETLKEAYSLAKEQQIRMQLEAAMRLLNQDQYRRAVTNQEMVIRDLRELLKVLESENRGDRLKDDQARIREYIKEVERLERMQRSVRGRTEAGLDAQQAADEQDQVSKRTEALQRTIEENEGQTGESNAGESSAGEPGPSDAAESSDEGADPGGAEPGETPEPSAPSEPREGEPSPSEPEPSDSEPSEGEPSDSQPSEGEPSDSESAEGSEPSQPSQPSESDPATPGSPSQGQPSGSSDPPPESEAPDFPGQPQIQQAQQQMEQAREALEQAERDKAIDRQKEAAKKLAEAKAKLEEILRQMREDEIERTLALLETRFQKMLEMQLRVNERTVQLAGSGSDEASSQDRLLEVESSKLSFQEKRIVVEADKALTLLHEEGSSIAFPETVHQMRDDMQRVADRLAEAQVGLITQRLEDDIVQSLEEMIAALQMAQQEQQERKNSQESSPQTGTPGEMPLVNAIAELKMIKSLQLRINKRTNLYAQMLDDVEDPTGQATNSELIELLQDLAQHELRVQTITHDLATGKNK